MTYRVTCKNVQGYTGRPRKEIRFAVYAGDVIEATAKAKVQASRYMNERWIVTNVERNAR